MFAVLLTMREIHRPIHPAFIYAKDWILMSDEEKSTATREGKIRLVKTKIKQPKNVLIIDQLF